MRVAMIGQKGIPATYGGIERHVDEIARRLVPMGIEVHLTNTPDWDSSAPIGPRSSMPTRCCGREAAS